MNHYNNDDATGTLSLFQIIKKTIYLKRLVIPTARQGYITRHISSIRYFTVKHDCFKNSFFPSTIIEMNNLGFNIRDPGTFQETHSSNSTVHCHNLKGLKLITRRLRLRLNHLRFDKFKHSSQDTLNTICNCGTAETTIHYLLHCSNFSNERLTLFTNFKVLTRILK